MKTPTLASLTLTSLCALTSVSWAQGPLPPQDPLLFDRGLPAAHVNEMGADQSNIVLAPNPELPDFLLGDDFILPGNDHYMVTKIRVWAVDADDFSTEDDVLDLQNLVLWGGLDKKSIGEISSNPTITAATYPDGQPAYIGYLGNVYPLYQIDFEVNLRVKGGKLFDFFLDDEDDTPFLHASNRVLSGNTQQGADDTILFLGPEGDIFTYHTSEDPAVWDKDADANVQVFGTSEKKAPKPKK